MADGLPARGRSVDQSQSLVLSQDQKEQRLSQRELASYQAYMGLGQAPMAASTQAQFFQLFLNGSTCEEIIRLNPNGFSLGAVVRARIENSWDQKLDEHKAYLMDKVRERVQQVQLETVERVALEIAVNNKLASDKNKRFLQTGNEEELAGMGAGGLKHLQALTALLLTLTGQDTKKSTTQVVGVVDHRHSAAPADPNALPVPPAAKPFSPDQAASYLEIIHQKKQGS